jgi:hypothetical protein
MANFLNGLNNFVNTINSTAQQVGSVLNTVNNVRNAFRQVTNPASFMSNVRLGNLPAGATYQPTQYTTAGWTGFGEDTGGSDWRVRLEVPPIPYFQDSAVLQPLATSNNSMVFPTTPQIMITHSANYSSIAPTHSNYAFPVYQSSQVEDITITGEWPVENEIDGLYWIASVHFLRSLTKMSYGKSSNQGAPPPLTKLRGYGDFVFNGTPCILKLFTTDLPDSVDYIRVPVGSNFSSQSEIPEIAITSGQYAMVPTLSRLSITVQPVYSRDKIRNFSLDDYVRGQNFGNGGFI